jgi:hypothetical protein
MAYYCDQGDRDIRDQVLISGADWGSSDAQLCFTTVTVHTRCGAAGDGCAFGFMARSNGWTA